ncbi:hypothetical protein D915_003163 [Fasciola hepatica]|uniref:Uncharacterized protein n=1 Tax=Fasciola hepatica TaxID=6192 RepID=A0A4E0RWR9_FASHE|nr:hypothetical protein D915_003163 [Fasciola hepatica]
MSQHVVPPLDDNVQLSVSEYRNRLYQMIISKKMRMRARKRDLNEINKSTPSHGNSTNVMSTTSKTEPVTGVTVSSSHPGSRAGQSSVISAISVSVGVDRKPDRLRREHQASMRHHMNGTNGTRVKVTRNSADSPNNTRSEPLIQAIPETVTCKRGKSVQRRSFTPVASVVTEMDVENNRTELADSVNHTNGHGESTISNKPSYSSLADIQQLIEDRNEIESGNRAISFNGLDRISTVTTGKLLGHAFPSAYVGSMEQTTYERGLEASSSRANSAEACQSSSLILDKSMGSNRSKGQKHLMMGSNSTEIPTERQGNSPLTVMGPDRAPNFKSTSYIDIHQKSSRAAVNANRCASSLAGRRVAFEPISKAIRDASHSQPDELRTDSPLIFNTGSELSNVDYGNPYPGRSRTVMNHTNFSDWYTDECADRKNPLKPADDLDSRAGGIGQRGTQRIYPSRMLSSAYYPEKGSKENKSNSGQKNTASFDWNRSNQKSAYKYDANNHDLSEHSSGSVTNAHCFTSDVINVSSLGPPNDRTSTHHYQNSAHNEARSRVRVDPPAHVNATHSTAISNANTDLPSYGNYFRRNHNTNGEDRSHTTDANRLHFMSTPIIGSSTQPTNYQPDGGQSTNFLSSTQPTGVSELLPRSHPNGTLGQLLRDYQSRIRLASHNALTGNITVQGNRRGSETKMTAGLEASNGVRSLLESEYPSREEKNHFTANRLTTAGHPARGYSASRRLWSPLGHNAFSHTDPLVPVPASRNKSPLFERPLSRTSHQPGHDMIVSQTPILSRTAEKNGSTPSINMIPKHLRTNPTRSTIEPIHPSIYSQATSHDNRDSLSVNASRLRSSSRSATMIQSTVNPSSTVHKTNGTYGRMKSYTNHIQLPPAVAETRYRMKF